MEAKKIETAEAQQPLRSPLAAVANGIYFTVCKPREPKRGA